MNILLYYIVTDIASTQINMLFSFYDHITLPTSYTLSLATLLNHQYEPPDVPDEVLPHVPPPHNPPSEEYLAGCAGKFLSWRLVHVDHHTLAPGHLHVFQNRVSLQIPPSLTYILAIVAGKNPLGLGSSLL